MPDTQCDFTGKNVLIMGLGMFGGGVDAAKFAAKNNAKVIVTDKNKAEKLQKSINQLKEFTNIEFHLGGHSKADFENADIIIVNPAVNPNNEFLQIARKKNKLITSQINIFFELCRATIIGITGANGKSTTAALTAYLLKNVIAKQSQKTGHGTRATSHEIWLSGNIGNQPLLNIIDKIKPDDIVVLELSSFQLEQLAEIKKAPQIALATNITPNHLDRHGTFESYCAAKENIFKFQSPNSNRPAVSIFNAEDKITSQWFEKYKKDKNRSCLKFSAKDVAEEISNKFALPGKANLSNLAAAMAIAKQFEISDEQIKTAIGKFKSLPHRLEQAAEINGVKYYNDSIATTPESTIAALEAFSQPKIIIAGGSDKNVPFDKLGEKIAKKAKAAILIGQTAEKIAKEIEKKSATESAEKKVKVEIVASLAEAVKLASKIAVKGDVVLLSPSCASYDMFDNFQQRGEEFIRLTGRIKS